MKKLICKKSNTPFRSITKMVCLIALLAMLPACTTVRIPTPYGEATATTPAWMTQQQTGFKWTLPTGESIELTHSRGTDPQATALVTGVVSAAVAGAIKGAKP